MGANNQTVDVDSALLVSIHAPVMGANVSSEAMAQILAVSIHAPVMGANSAKTERGRAIKFQSTHP